MRAWPVLLVFLLVCGGARADERDDVRADIRIESARIGRLKAELDQLDRDIAARRVEHEAAGHPRIVLAQHRRDTAALDQRVAEAVAARNEAERKAGWHDGGFWGSLASLALWAGLSEERSWRGEDLVRTGRARDAAIAARAAADAAFEQKLQGGIRVAPLRPSDWAEYPLGRPNDVFAPSLEALERMADEGDLRQASLTQEIALLSALREERAARLREAEERLRLLQIRERGLDVPTVPPTPETLVVGRYRGGLHPALRAAFVAGFENLCRQYDSVLVENTLESTPVIMEVRRTPEGDRATISDGELRMKIASRGRATGNGRIQVRFTFEEGVADTDGVFRGKVEAVVTGEGHDTERPLSFGPRTSKGTWIARPTAGGGRGYTLHFDNDQNAAFVLEPVGP